MRIRLHQPAPLIAVAAAGVVLICGYGPSAATATKTSPGSELAKVLTTGKQQRSVRWTSSDTVASVQVSETTVAGTTSGTQSITFSDGAVGHATVLLLNHTAYLKGDDTTLAGFMGFTTSDAEDEAGVWIAVPSHDAEYQTLASGLTISSIIGGLNMHSAGLSQAADQKLNGTSVIVLTGNTFSSDVAPATVQTLYVAATGKALPIEAKQRQAGGGATVKFSDWNSSFQVAAPSNTVPFQPSWIATS